MINFDILSDKFRLEHRFHKGGSGSAPAASPTRIAAPNPPITDRLSDFSSLEREEKRRASRRKGFKSTILAGESGGKFGQQMNTAFGTKTLLGA